MSNDEAKSKCFVIMPISDHDDYDAGHFKRVYEHIIRPACDSAGLNALRADDVLKTNYIIIDILRHIVEAPIAICDLSTRNPNVLYELGIRHAFNLPVVLMKDSRTDRVFDVQGIRTLDYDKTLRIDSVHRDTQALSKVLTTTINGSSDVNSIVQLLGIAKAEINTNEVTPETSLLLDAIRDVSQRLTRLEEREPLPHRIYRQPQPEMVTLPNGERVRAGQQIGTSPADDPIGELIAWSDDSILVRGADGEEFTIPPEDERFGKLSLWPF